ncbi:hypothetical protein J0X19_17175 [Hymenobacter sp. BT186]|uniref:Uncharacterized protein n=1 Tax=Hymenobacter telluris TaxID=2816474 RepID=A0A939JC07_9BACT|nr:hypothetical protein [Hymenobacter telluris]MBO0359696.1 hypothetical protein [Hymenobacter telluris]MBW3375723.1 hypothetical protein [Hymenobacter norwichensis]
MQNHSLTPWNFVNDEQQLYSPDASQSLKYESLQEMNQGGPLHGSCFWVTSGNKQYRLPGTYGGPPVWDAKSRCVALPLWQTALISSTGQRIALLNTRLRKLVVFQQKFRVLHLQALEGWVVTGLDSPIYTPSPLFFNFETAAIKHVFEL